MSNLINTMLAATRKEYGKKKFNELFVIWVERGNFLKYICNFLYDCIAFKNGTWSWMNLSLVHNDYIIKYLIFQKFCVFDRRIRSLRNITPFHCLVPCFSLFFFFFFFCIYLFTYLLGCAGWLQYAGSWIFSWGMWTFSCSMWNLYPWPGIKPRPLNCEHSLSHWTTKEDPLSLF